MVNEYIISKLKELHSVFPHINIRYEFRITTNTHIIEVLPLDFYEKDEDYLKFEDNFEDEFIEKYPQSDIMFISSDSITEIINIDFEILGENNISNFIEFELSNFGIIDDSISEENCTYKESTNYGYAVAA